MITKEDVAEEFAKYQRELTWRALVALNWTTWFLNCFWLDIWEEDDD